MILNEQQPKAKAKLDAELAAHDCLKLIVEAARKFDAPFRIEPEGSGLEFSVENDIKGLPNRGRLKVFFPVAESGGPGLRVVGIFYKPSNLSFSRDRFSYGGFLSSPSKLKDEDIDAWLAFLASGLSPANRPRDLRRAFPYTVPE